MAHPAMLIRQDAETASSWQQGKQDAITASSWQHGQQEAKSTKCQTNVEKCGKIVLIGSNPIILGLFYTKIH